MSEWNKLIKTKVTISDKNICKAFETALNTHGLKIIPEDYNRIIMANHLDAVPVVAIGEVVSYSNGYAYVLVNDATYNSLPKDQSKIKLFILCLGKQDDPNYIVACCYLKADETDEKSDDRLTLSEFVNRFIAPNTIIRIWRELADGHGHGMIIDQKSGDTSAMSWEVDKEDSWIHKYAENKVIHITDIVIWDVNDPESVNIVIDA